MVREKQFASDQRLAGASAVSPTQELLETWLQKLRNRLPEGGTAVVTIHKLPRRQVLVAFRASAFGETFISEARKECLEDGIEEAGRSLFDRLGQNPPQPKARFREKVRRLLGDGGESSRAVS